MSHLVAAMLSDALTRRSGVEGWKVEPKTSEAKGGRLECEMSVKPPQGWTILHGEDGSLTPARLPKAVAFSFSFAKVLP